MKTDNPTPFETTALPMIGRGDRPTLPIIVKGTFSFASGKIELAAEQLPIAFGDSFYKKKEGGGVRYESDVVPFKPKTDVVLSGKAYAPDNQPAKRVDVVLSVGPVKKQLAVFGRRLWNYAGVLSKRYTITETEPFVRFPIRYKHAFGGIDEANSQYCDRNMSGKGFYAVDTKTKLTGWPLPRIEDPRHLIRTPKDHPKPVGFDFYNRAWQPRATCAGTYDKAWRKKRRPKPPKDFNYHYYNGAHPDLQVKGYLKGHEPVEMINLVPEGGIRFNLPGVRPVCHIERTHKEEREQVQMNLDTVFFEPEKRRFCLVWRGVARLAAMSTTEIKQLTIHAENIG